MHNLMRLSVGLLLEKTGSETVSIERSLTPFYFRFISTPPPFT